jgi:hypothetical protein
MNPCSAATHPKWSIKVVGSETHLMKKLTMAAIDRGAPAIDHQRLGHRRLAK